MRCSSSGNGSPAKRTVLHDLYEKEGQSPWYDNLCRPVTDLLPLIASGVRGVTSNPAVNLLYLLFLSSFLLIACKMFSFIFLIQSETRLLERITRIKQMKRLTLF